jgi:hypothetical protein
MAVAQECACESGDEKRPSGKPHIQGTTDVGHVVESIGYFDGV